LTIESLKTSHPSIPFNPDVATAFFRAGLIEAWGRGTLKIIEACRKANFPRPVFAGDASGFGVKFRSSTEIVRGKMSEKILTLVEKNPKITIRDLSQEIGVTERTIERNLKTLQEQNKIKRVGSARGGHWKILR